MKDSSIYLEAYLKENDFRGANKGITTGTFLSQRLRGKAARYKDRYQRALENALEKSGAVKGKSDRGAIAWYRK